MGDGQNRNGGAVKEAPEAVNHTQTVCRRCKEQYTASSNSPNACRFHPSFFVCRRHDDQKSRIMGQPIDIDWNINLSNSWLQNMQPITTGIPTKRSILITRYFHWHKMWLSKLDLRWYYELGPDDPPYAAKFYDCCGAEDASAPGCTTSFHISYDDE